MDTISSLKWRFMLNYTVVHRVLSEVNLLRPDFAPVNVMDFGCGSGPASVAAFRIFGETLGGVNGVDRSRSQREAYSRILSDVVRDYNEKASRSEGDFVGVNVASKFSLAEKKYELVLSSYVLGEQRRAGQVFAATRELWATVKEGGIMVVIEPGTPQGFRNIMKIRDMVLKVRNHDDEKELGRRKRRKKSGRRSSERKERSGIIGIEEGWGSDDDLFQNEEGMWMKPDEEFTGPEMPYRSSSVPDAELIAPCTHSEACPLLSRARWYSGLPDKIQYCSFHQPVVTVGNKRSSNAKHKGEKFSYIVLRKKCASDAASLSSCAGGDDGENEEEEEEEEEVEGALSAEARNARGAGMDGDQEDDSRDGVAIGRIIRSPIKKKGHILVDMCVDDAGGPEIARLTVSRGKHGKPAYKSARKSKWGGLFPYFPQEGDGRQEL